MEVGVGIGGPVGVTPDTDSERGASTSALRVRSPADVTAERDAKGSTKRVLNEAGVIGLEKGFGAGITINLDSDEDECDVVSTSITPALALTDPAGGKRKRSNM